MGANAWRHAPAIAAMSDESLELYLTSTREDEFYRLAATKDNGAAPLEMTIDFADRTTRSRSTRRCWSAGN